MTTTTAGMDTPMLRQYAEIKADHQDAILFFRLGDFYEMFLSDATLAAQELGLTLTGRGKDEKRVPMCGVPHHAADGYVAKLITKGYKVAICEQVEEASESKGITKREVTRIVTPGTVIDEGILDESSNNFMSAIYRDPKSGGIGLAAVDVSTGEFLACNVASNSELKLVLDQWDSKEVLVAHDETETSATDRVQTPYFPLEPTRADESLRRHFNIASLTGYGLTDDSVCAPACWGIIEYLKTTQKNAISQINKITPYMVNHRMVLDGVTIKNLELVQSLDLRNKKGTLFHLLNATKTAMGARLLKAVLQRPFKDRRTIEYRQAATAELQQDILSREEIREVLKQVYDLERLIGRIMAATHNPRDLMALTKSLNALADLPSIVTQLKASYFQDTLDNIENLNKGESGIGKCRDWIEAAIIDDPPPTIRDGNVIRDGIDEELDRLRASFKDIKQWIASLEQQEREATGIKTLKVRFNKVFGYYFEVSKSQQDQVPEHYIRKQTLTNAERYITPELKEKETILLNGEEKQKAIEQRVYHELIERLTPLVPSLQDLAKAVADVDVIQSLAHVAQKHRYVMPKMQDADTHVLSITNGRHPVLESTSDTPFIPNDVHMTQDESRFMLITGPNMAGKSTLMRQVALIVIMAQIGGGVPADRAEIGIVDTLFTRIGALDNLYFGQSTFMVEMLETATILNTATENSLIILDEIGRGTATFDGMSIAYSVSEYIYSKIGARTLFATHYHELTSLADRYPACENYRLKITEEEGRIVFQHKLIKGPANRSYGVHVAQMAGLPQEVVDRANTILDGLESEGSTHLTAPSGNQLSLF